MGEELYSEGRALTLLNQLERILETDVLIDEVGFIHPSQFSGLNEDAGDENMNFWNRDHKLGISTQVLLPLYRVAKHVFMTTIDEYKLQSNLSVERGKIGHENMLLPSSNSSPYEVLEDEIMKHSKALLLLNSDFGTAWNARKLVLSKKQSTSAFMDELLLASLVLSSSPKSEQAWSHRRWVIKNMAGNCSNVQEIVGKESELVENIAERSKMNYRAWNHRCWLVPYMTRRQIMDELNKSRNWAALHVADNSCFHYRRRLMHRMLDDSAHKQDPNACFAYVIDTHQMWKEELHWNEMLIKRYIGREALWLHRRFLSLYWIQHFTSDLCGLFCHPEFKNSKSHGTETFLDNELQLLRHCSTIQDNHFEDFQAQAKFSVIYFLWLIKVASLKVSYTYIYVCRYLERERERPTRNRNHPRRREAFHSSPQGSLFTIGLLDHFPILIIHVKYQDKLTSLTASSINI